MESPETVAGKSLLCRLGMHEWDRPAHTIWQAWERVYRSCQRPGCDARRSEHCDRDRHYEEHHTESWTD